MRNGANPLRRFLPDRQVKLVIRSITFLNATRFRKSEVQAREVIHHVLCQTAWRHHYCKRTEIYGKGLMEL